MNHDCGILYPSELGTEIRRASTAARLSPEARHSLRVLMSTPGFSMSFLIRALGVSATWLRSEWRSFNDEDYRQEAIDNWSSITREEALRLCQISGKGSARPVICTVYMVEDIYNGKPWLQTAKEWGVDDMTIYHAWKQTPFVFRSKSLPKWFFELVPT